MIKDNYLSGKEARERLIAGITKVAAIVGGTMGTDGKNVLIECLEHPGHLNTNDGETILRALKFADPVEEMARLILLEAVSRANKLSGDLSSTTCVLTASILIEGIRHLEENSAMDIYHSLVDLIPTVKESILRQKREITVDEVGAVASISAEDTEIGAMIQEIYQKIGKEGIIHWDISKTVEDTYTIGHGLTIEGARYYSPYMCDVSPGGQSTNQIRLKDAQILITKQKISTVAEFNNINFALNSREIKDIVVFCDDVDPLVIPDLLKTRLERGFRTILVKMPVIFKDQWFEDLALASGATLIDPASGLSLKTATLQHLGSFENITITKDDTMIDGIRDLSDHIKALEDEGTDESKLRASRLNTKTARYFVGARSDSALSYRRLKVEDAIASAYHALNGGIVPGGGSSMYVASKNLPDSVGGKILKKALLFPVKQIVSNCGRIPWTEKKWWQIRNRNPYIFIGDDFDFDFGFDTRTKSFVNMFEAEITDPANIVINALENAISVAASILTDGTVITLPREEMPNFHYPPNMRMV